jgi:glucose-6-phosphate 1-epimerase
MSAHLDALLQAHPEVTVEAQGDHAMLRVRTPAASALVSLHGGQLLSFAPRGFDDLLWCSPHVPPAPQAIRGGVPVCWPYFGRQGQAGEAPQHGFARNRRWHLQDIARIGDDIELRLALPADASTPLRVWQTLRIGATLRQSLVTRNDGDATETFTCALHSYFRVSDAMQAKVTGLQGLAYTDKYDGGRHLQQGDWDLRDPRDPGRCDRLYHDAGDRFELIDAPARRTVVLRTAGSRSLVVWNPGAEAGASMADVGTQWSAFVCLETANAGEDVVTLAPGGVHALEQTVEVVAHA